MGSKTATKAHDDKQVAARTLARAHDAAKWAAESAREAASVLVESQYDTAGNDAARQLGLARPIHEACEQARLCAKQANFVAINAAWLFERSERVISARDKIYKLAALADAAEDYATLAAQAIGRIHATVAGVSESIPPRKAKPKASKAPRKASKPKTAKPKATAATT